MFLGIYVFGMKNLAPTADLPSAGVASLWVLGVFAGMAAFVTVLRIAGDLGNLLEQRWRIDADSQYMLIEANWMSFRLDSLIQVRLRRSSTSGFAVLRVSGFQGDDRVIRRVFVHADVDLERLARDVATITERLSAKTSHRR
ncbi:MAG: hypothetical protein AAFN41_03115 [Planctomycetota bacterium]